MSTDDRFRLTLRSKVLGLLLGVLLTAMVTYLGLAIHLINDDRLAYTFDFVERLASTLSAQVQASMDSMSQRLMLFGSLAVRATDQGARQELARELLEADPDLVRVRLYRRDRDGALVQATEAVAWDRLGPIELPPADLEALDRRVPVPLAAAARMPVLVVNRSLPPSAQLLTVAVAAPPSQEGLASWVVSADTTVTRLQALFTGSSIYRAYLVDGDGVVLTHPDAAKVLGRASLAELPPVQAALGEQRARSGVLEFTADGGRRLLGAWSRIEPAHLAVIAEADRDAALATTRRLVRLSWMFGGGIFLVAILVALVFSRRLTTPLRRLQEATAELAIGNYGVVVDVDSGDEIGDLARDFRKMAQDIRDGQLELIQSEKLATFGQLGAGITHEVKNPLTAIRGFAQLGLYYADDPKQVQESFKTIESESERCLGILQNFLSFARQDPGKRTRLDLNELTAHAVRLAAHQIKTCGIQLHQRLGEPPPVEVAGGHMEQVLLNLLLNAQQALGRGGNIWVTTRALEDGRAELEVRDDGPGIGPEAMSRIFEPFFTTKPSGRGTGLGLSVSDRIVREHGGEIVVHSTAGAGAVFLVRLPAASPQSGAAQGEPTETGAAAGA